MRRGSKLAIDGLFTAVCIYFGTNALFWPNDNSIISNKCNLRGEGYGAKCCHCASVRKENAFRKPFGFHLKSRALMLLDHFYKSAADPPTLCL